MAGTETNDYMQDGVIINAKDLVDKKTDIEYGSIEKWNETTNSKTSGQNWREWCRVEPLIILFYTATSAIAILYPQLLYDLIANDMGYGGSGENETGECSANSDNTYSKTFRENSSILLSRGKRNTEVTEADVQGEVNFWNMFVLGSVFLPAVFMVVLVGSWGDKVGRKKALILSTAGCTMRTLVYLFIALFDLPLWTWIIAGVLEGITGGTFAVLSSSFAYVIDVTPVEKRSRNIVILEMCTGLGSIIAFVGTGALISSLGYAVPIGICLIIYVACFFYALFLLPESKHTLEKERLLTFKHFKRAFRMFLPKVSPLTTRRALYLGLLLLLLVYIFTNGGESVLNYYLLNYPLCWEPLIIGVYKATDYIIQAIGAVVLMRLLYKRLGELGLVIIGCVCGAAMNMFLAFSTTTAMIFLSSLFGCGIRIAPPMTRAILSRCVSKEQQGAMMSLSSLCTVIPLLLGNIIFNSIYSSTVDWFRGFAFLFVSICFAFPIILALVLIYVSKKGYINLSFKYEEGEIKNNKDEKTQF